MPFFHAFHRLMEHENDPDIDEPYVPPVGNVLGAADSPAQPSPTQPAAETGEGGKWTQRRIIAAVTSV